MRIHIECENTQLPAGGKIDKNTSYHLQLEKYRTHTISMRWLQILPMRHRRGPAKTNQPLARMIIGHNICTPCCWSIASICWCATASISINSITKLEPHGRRNAELVSSLCSQYTLALYARRITLTFGAAAVTRIVWQPAAGSAAVSFTPLVHISDELCAQLSLARAADTSAHQFAMLHSFVHQTLRFLISPTTTTSELWTLVIHSMSILLPQSLTHIVCVFDEEHSQSRIYGET